MGAGVGGLACAIDLARRGLPVTVYDRHDRPGGKMRGATVDGVALDTGPTVLTMAGVFEALFRDAGAVLRDAVALSPAGVLARHSWPDGSGLDLVADRRQNRRAIADFASARDAEGYARFCRDAGRIFGILDPAMMRAPRPSMWSLARACGVRDMLAIRPFRTLAASLGDYFEDGRLRQLFGRYATYVGSSPWRAPATTMLIAHLEQEGVWLVEGGMRALAGAMADLARAHGAAIELGRAVAAIERRPDGRVSGLRLADGERVGFDRVVCNADPGALASGILAGARRAVSPAPRARDRSLSAITWTGRAVVRGMALDRHNVLFSRDGDREFAELFGDRRAPSEPTVYVCAQERPGAVPPGAPERLLVLVNAPAATGGRAPASPGPADTARMLARLAAHGLRLEGADRLAVTGPDGFARDHPGTGGALYGGVTHGWRSTFRRPGSRAGARIPGLYLAGGGAHPGPGVPMAAISGRLAASALIEDLGSTRRSPVAAISGGISTPVPTTGCTASR